ncbi:MAG: ribonuclease HII, partial [Anaerolineales bacterium]|nr:ribonuclease HII [Anaerolineales bacterium]
ALAQLAVAPDYLLIDGRIRLAAVNLPQASIIRGDSLSLSIAAASILAKVTRDRLMVALAEDYPCYGLERHKGYGTAVHLSALIEHGPALIHRHSFAPIRQSLFE